MNERNNYPLGVSHLFKLAAKGLLAFLGVATIVCSSLAGYAGQPARSTAQDRNNGHSSVKGTIIDRTSLNAMRAKLWSQTTVPAQFGLQAMPAMSSPFAPYKIQAPDTAIANIAAPSWGVIKSAEGTSWIYSRQLINGSKSYRYKGAVITLYDDNYKQVGSFSVSLPDTTECNYIQPYGPITNYFFDRDISTDEIPVFLHFVGPNHTSIDSVFVYHTDGGLVQKFHADFGVMSSLKKNGSEYNRFLVSTEDTIEQDGQKVAVYKVDVYKPASYRPQYPTIEHTFYIPRQLTLNSDGSYVTAMMAGENPYFVVSHYAKPFVQGMDDSYNPIFTPDNSYCVSVYNSDYQLVDSISVPISTPADMFYRTASFGLLSWDDLSIGKFSHDNDMNITVTFTDNTSSDDFYYTYVVYNSQGEAIDTIGKNVILPIKMSDIKGQNEQYAFLQAKNNVQQFCLVDLPSCQEVGVIPYHIGNFYVSSYLDRYPVGDSYQYVIGGRSSRLDADSNVIAQVGWVNRDISLSRTVDLNLGPKATLFSPNISADALNPYLVNTNEGHEYMYIAERQRPNSTKYDEFLVVTDSLGNPLRRFEKSDTLGDINSATLLNCGTTHPALMVAYLKDNAYNLSFYSLPFTAFEQGGDGTETNPFLIASKGDLMRMEAYPEAHYKVVNDIDMGGGYTGWKPIANFAGKLNGGNHVLSNLTIENSSETSLGLFGDLRKGAAISNLTLSNPVISCTSSTRFTGALAGQATMYDTISNVRVNGLLVSDNGLNAVSVTGGIVGQATGYTEIGSCLVNQCDIQLPNSNRIGGIAGNTSVNSNISSCSANGSIHANRLVGGIVGSTSKNCKVTNSHANMQLEALYNIGGIAGQTARGRIENCYAQGSISATEAGRSSWSVGGIVGYLTANMKHTDDSAIVNCLAAQDSIVVADTTNKVAIHRIAGYTTDNMNLSSYKEQGLHGNYALSSMACYVEGEPNDSSADGASVAKDGLNKDFFTQLGFKYGTDEANPWKTSAYQPLPLLYFEEDVSTGISAISGSYVSRTAADVAGTLGKAKTVAVYDTTGKLLKMTDGAAVLSSLPLDKGIYVLKAILPDGKALTLKVMR